MDGNMERSRLMVSSPWVDSRISDWDKSFTEGSDASGKMIFLSEPQIWYNITPTSRWAARLN